MCRWKKFHKKPPLALGNSLVYLGLHNKVPKAGWLNDKILESEKWHLKAGFIWGCSLASKWPSILTSPGLHSARRTKFPLLIGRKPVLINVFILNCFFKDPISKYRHCGLVCKITHLRKSLSRDKLQVLSLKIGNSKSCSVWPKQTIFRINKY